MKQSADNDLTDYQNLLDFAIIQKNPFEWCPEEITFMILELAAIANYLSDGHTGSLRYVCQDWRYIMKQGKIKKSIELIQHGQIYQRFLKGLLVYTPQEGSAVGQIVLRITDLENPLEGTFDLSQCGDTGKYLSISTGYRKGRRAENTNKLEIWFTPRFLIEKELTTSAGFFKYMYGQWSDSAPVGVFWTWGGSDSELDYDCLVKENIDELSNSSLYEKWRAGAMHRSWSFKVTIPPKHDTHTANIQKKFMIKFP